MANSLDSFQSMRLNDYDFNKPLPADLYTFVISGAETKTASTGTEFLSVKLTIVDNDRFSGRKVSERFFANRYSGGVLAKLAALSGVNQEDDETVEEWLNRLAEQQPAIRFAVPFTVEESDFFTDSDGKPQEVNKISWFEAQLA